MPDIRPTEQDLDETEGFHWAEVPSTSERRLAALTAPADPPLGGIAGFHGTFKGNGLNTIFRPQDFAVSPTPLPVPGTGKNDNVLEINLTEETLSFHKPLGTIPNRGSVQGDISLNGIPYLQSINDVTDPANPVGIHFEPGVWLAVPATNQPEENISVVRMASIPHGTTVEAQGVSFSRTGGPVINPVDITPFPNGNPAVRISFPSQTLTNTNTFRLPQDLTSFNAAGTITQAILTNPNSVLQTRAAAQNITSTTVIQISTNPADPNFGVPNIPNVPAAPQFGGGTDNIAFLQGDAAPNAQTLIMAATFWIETVSEQIVVPPFTGAHPRIIQGSTAAGDPVVSFSVTSRTPHAHPTTVEVSYTQIQYTQLVLLNFAGLSWPHVSVATLVPNRPVKVEV